MTTPPGWYPDPNDPSKNRYWDGAQWAQTVPPARTRRKPKMRTSRKWMIAGLVILALGLGLSGLAKLLYPSSTDGKFDKATSSLMPSKTASERRALARQVCSSLDAGGSVFSIGSLLPTQTLSDAAVFIGDSVAAYCPRNRSRLGP